jgi:hypothetical protein
MGIRFRRKGIGLVAGLCPRTTTDQSASDEVAEAGLHMRISSFETLRTEAFTHPLWVRVHPDGGVIGLELERAGNQLSLSSPQL